jgi:hypothetical protein
LRDRAPVYAVEQVLVEFVFIAMAIDVTGKRASWTTLNGRLHGKLSQRIRKHHRAVKIDKCRLVPAPMGIMTLGAGDLFIDDVGLVRPEALITEDAPSFMAGIAEFIGPWTFRPLCTDVSMLQNRLIDRSMRSFGA